MLRAFERPPGLCSTDRFLRPVATGYRAAIACNASGFLTFVSMSGIAEGRDIVSCRFRYDRLPVMLLMMILMLAVAASLAGCGVVAAPVRATSAVVKVVPVAGDVVAAPLDVTADTID